MSRITSRKGEKETGTPIKRGFLTGQVSSFGLNDVIEIIFLEKSVHLFRELVQILRAVGVLESAGDVGMEEEVRGEVLKILRVVGQVGRQLGSRQQRSLVRPTPGHVPTE